MFGLFSSDCLLFAESFFLLVSVIGPHSFSFCAIFSHPGVIWVGDALLVYDLLSFLRFITNVRRESDEAIIGLLMSCFAIIFSVLGFLLL